MQISIYLLSVYLSIYLSIYTYIHKYIYIYSAWPPDVGLYIYIYIYIYIYSVQGPPMLGMRDKALQEVYLVLAKPLCC